jgi:hypothetical protein
MYPRIFKALLGVVVIGGLVLAGCGDDEPTEPPRDPDVFFIPTELSLEEAGNIAIPGDTLIITSSLFPLDNTVTFSSHQTPLVIIGNKDRPTLSILIDAPILRFVSPNAGTKVAQVGFSGGRNGILAENAGRIEVEDCRFSGGSIQVVGAGSGLVVDVSGCLMRDAGLFSIEAKSSATAVATNNTIDGSMDCGILLIDGAQGQVNSCIISNSSRYGIACQQGGILTPASGCNDIYMSGTAPYENCTPGVDDFSLDPLFCTGANDFTIQDISPCAPANSPSGCGLIGAFPPAVCPPPP